jgi:hypothetical protein
VGPAGDEYEREADRVAEAVTSETAQPSSAHTFLRAPQQAAPLQRKCSCGGTCSSCQEEEEEKVQRKEAASAVSSQAASDAPPIVDEVLRSPGQPLDPATRAYFEPRFGYDFSGVRVHSDPRAAASAAGVSALAYTVGDHLAFGEGQYRPASQVGQKLLAHELAHVVQQGRGGAAPSLDPSGHLETSADTAATNALHSSGPVPVNGASGVGLARAPADPYRGPYQEFQEMLQELEEDFGRPSSGSPKEGGASVIHEAQEAGFLGKVTPGKPGAIPGKAGPLFLPYKAASEARSGLGVPGSVIGFMRQAESWEWLKKNWRTRRGQIFEAAHMGPGRFLEHNAQIGRIQGYDYREALTTLLPKNVHRKIDKLWLDWLEELRSKGVKEVTVKQLREKMAEGIESVKPGTGNAKLTPETKGALHEALFQELHIKLGLPHHLKLEVPPPSKFNFKTVGGAGLAALGGVLEYSELKGSGHGTLESLAQAVGSTLGGFATPGGKAGIALGIGAMGLHAAGAPEPAKDAVQSASDVLNFTGASLGQVFRADVNIHKAVLTGDWKDFDRQTKEITQGKAGLPLEGYFRTVDIGADLLSGKNFEQVMLKQKFSGAEKGLWYVVGGDQTLRTVKFVENLAKGKGPKDAFDDADKQFHDSLEDDISKWASKQTTQFVKHDLPEAAEFAKKDIKGLVDKGKAQVAKVINKVIPKQPEANQALTSEPASPPPLREAVQELKAEAKQKFDQAASTVKDKYEHSKQVVSDEYQKAKALLGGHLPF